MKTGLLPGISDKIRAGYYAVVVVLLGFAILTLLEIRYVQEKMAFGEDVAELLNVTLEVRRFEKNYFLYHQADDLRENRLYLQRAMQIMQKTDMLFQSLATPEQLAVLRRDLGSYSALMAAYEERLSFGRGRPSDAAGRREIESEVRTIGKRMTTIVEAMSRIERRNLDEVLRHSTRIVLLAVGALAMVGIGAARVLSRRVSRPLKQLEERMRTIAEGRFESVEIDSRESEIISLGAAFNRMLHELDSRQRQLVRSEKLASLGTLLSGVAHELNNPLSNISTSAEILKEEMEGHDEGLKRELLEQIESQTDRARGIVRSLLDFARDREFRREMVSLRSLVEETLRFVRGHAPTRVEVTVDIDPDIRVFVDRQKMQQAILNLLKNAIDGIDAMDAVGVTDVVPVAGRVIVRGRSRESASRDSEAIVFGALPTGAVVEVEVTDTGAGIPAVLLPRICDPFFTTKDVGQGSGLGLSIVHEIVEQHDGALSVRSKVGGGTTFVVCLPAMAGEG